MNPASIEDEVSPRASTCEESAGTYAVVADDGRWRVTGLTAEQRDQVLAALDEVAAAAAEAALERLRRDLGFDD